MLGKHGGISQDAYLVHCDCNGPVIIVWYSDGEGVVGVRAVHRLQLCGGHVGWASHSEHACIQQRHRVSEGQCQVQHIAV